MYNVILSMSKLESAELFAKTKHAGMKRKDGVTDYFEHLKSVVNRLQNIGITDEDMLCTAWLHDTLEDTSTTFDELIQRFGKEVAVLVFSLSKDQTIAKKQKELQYVKQLKDATWQAKIIKLCDIASNLKELKTSGLSKNKRNKFVRQRRHYLNAIKNGIIENKSKAQGIDSVIDAVNEIFVEYRLYPVKF